MRADRQGDGGDKIDFAVSACRRYHMSWPPNGHSSMSTKTRRPTAFDRAIADTIAALPFGKSTVSVETTALPPRKPEGAAIFFFGDRYVIVEQAQA
jgi:hypothetical protein